MEQDLQTSSTSSQPQTLFPIASYINVEGVPGRGNGFLFPCAQSSLHIEKENGISNDDWLSNPSFTSPIEHQGVISSDHQQDISDSGSSEGDGRHGNNDEDVYDKDDQKHKKPKKRHKSPERVVRLSHKKKKKKHKSKHSRKDKLAPSVKYKNEEHQKPNTIWIEECGLELKDAYRVYSKPDVNNLAYGSLYRLDVALYKLKPRIVCIGLGKHQSVHLTEKSKKDKKKRRAENVRYWGVQIPPLSEVQSVAPQKRATTEFFSGNIQNYVYVPLDLPSGGNEANNRQVNAENLNDEGGTMEEYTSHYTSELNKKLRENPHDIAAWLELVDHQQEVVSKGQLRAGFTEALNEKKKRNQAVITEKQISVLEKALEQNPSSEILIHKHLELCSEIWSVEDLRQRWNKVVFTHPNKVNLWHEYLRFTQSRFSSFSFSKAQGAYAKCLSTLLALKEGTFQSHQAQGDIESDMLDVFHQFCLFLKQSGHMEKAVASLQAMIELNCFCPGNIVSNTPTSGHLAFLETFWDSGKPRFGEDGAQGWKVWMEKSPHRADDCFDLKKIFKYSDRNKRNDAGEGEVSDGEERLIQGLYKAEAWRSIEISRDHTQVKPWRPNTLAGETEEDCEDPERLVLFEDVSACLFKLQNPQNNLRLVILLLELLGVPVNHREATNDFSFQRHFTTTLESKEEVLKTDRTSPGSSWKRYNSWYSHPAISFPTPEVLDFVRSIFAQAMLVFDGQDLDELMVTWLEYECSLVLAEASENTRKQKCKEVQKLAKALLKQPNNRNNLNLWREFACSLWMLGELSEARRIFDSTLAMAFQSCQDISINSELISLYRRYAELELSSSTLEDRKHRITELLVHLTEHGPNKPGGAKQGDLSAARILRARKTWSQLTEEALNSMHDGNSTNTGPSSYSLDVLICSAYFAYVTQGLQAASTTFERALVPPVFDGFCREALWLAYLGLYRTHMAQHTVPLKELRSILHSALREFPDNPEFLAFYLKVESKSNLTGEVRRFFDHGTHSAVSPVQWIYALHYEEVRSMAVSIALDCTQAALVQGSRNSAVTSLPMTGVTHRQRALFERVASSSVGRQCVLLWRMFVDFEMKQGSTDKAKTVFYQAVHHCPWAKSLYLDAVKYFAEDVTDTLDMMHEKGLRVRAPLEEIEILLQA
ncbi:nuclear exosome regulator NRDE2 [Nematostella vectensis]|uniref:nuclear exosome regulator NRDE2 n=1 Tax=Nematostella vectensis TaxID=45351 RepID=UPI00207796D3|nr:nuclear exosome regulator NRDE2 [Nematostella vectensis]